MSFEGTELCRRGCRSRRSFLQVLAFGSAALALPLWRSHAQQSENGQPPLASDPRRPTFHLLPARNWMNDPNGPIYFRGLYHMFFQYNPDGPVWGNMTWNHATSPDMLHWSLQPLALKRTSDGPDAAGCFSGSTIAVADGEHSRVYALYTGVVRDPDHETIPHEGLRESQCLAWSDDPQLRTWTKRAAPVIPNPPADIRVVGFRDPSVWKQDETYYMTVGSGIRQKGGCVLLYRSSNLVNWHYVHPLTMGSWSGKPTRDPVDDGEMWECPEMFPLGDSHVLIYSTLRKVFWQSGAFGSASLQFQGRQSGYLDLGTFYAPKTQLDAQGRRILWGWIPEQRSNAEMRAAGWSGMMSLPRLLSLDSDGSLRIRWLPEIASLRRQSRPIQITGSTKTAVLPQANGEVLWVGPRTKNAGIVIELPGKTVCIQYSRDAHRFRVAGKDVVLHPNDAPRIHLFVDGSVAEILLSERITVTERFYYTGSIAPSVNVQSTASDGHLEAWEIAAPSSDRLTSIAGGRG